jgi:serine/threonine-protein kinase RsbW
MLIVSASMQSGFTERTAGQVAMAVDEALCNIHRHGYQTEYGRAILEVSTTINPNPRINISIKDNAKQVELTQIKSRDLDNVKPGGLGVHLIRTVMDEATWTKRDEGGMLLTMHKTQTSTTSPETKAESEKSIHE